MTPPQPKIAVFGAGRWGMNHVRNFAELGALAAVVDPAPDARDRVAEVAPDVPVYADPDAVYGDANIPGVVLATPARTHQTDAEAALAAGKDVFVEKPMAMTAAEAEAMVAAAEAAGKLLMVGHLLLYQPAIEWIRGALSGGRVGRVLHVETRRLNLGRVRSFENVFWSFAPHDLAVLHVLLGEPELEAAHAFGQCAIQGTIEDQVHADFRFRGGATAHVHTAWFWPTKLRTTTIIGDRGMIVYDEVAQTVELYEARVDPESLEIQRGEHEEVPVADDQPLRLECQHFLDCIRERRQPLSHGRHGLEVVRMLEQASAGMAR